MAPLLILALAGVAQGQGSSQNNSPAYTNVFVRQNDEWKLVVHQATSIGKAAAAVTCTADAFN